MHMQVHFAAQSKLLQLLSGQTITQDVCNTVMLFTIMSTFSDYKEEKLQLLCVGYCTFHYTCEKTVKAFFVGGAIDSNIRRRMCQTALLYMQLVFTRQRGREVKNTCDRHSCTALIDHNTQQSSLCHGIPQRPVFKFTLPHFTPQLMFDT